MPERVIEQRADRVAEHAASDGGDGADGGEEPGPLGCASDIGSSMMSGGTGKNELSANETAARIQSA